MRRVVFVVPGAIETRTGGYIYDARMVAALRSRGWCVDVRVADLTAVPDGAIAVVDGLALLAPGIDVERHASRVRLVSLIHLPLALEAGLDRLDAGRREAIEQRALRASRLVIATGRVTVEQLAARQIDPSRVVLVEPGTDAAPLARGSGGDSVALVSVAAVTAGKGHETLLRALAAVRTDAWSLTCAGSVDRDACTADRLRQGIDELGLRGRVKLAGELDGPQLDALLDSSDAFATATFRETYGMAVAEAIARGLPVVGTSVGAIPQIVGDGGVLVDAGDAESLTRALTRVITDADFRRTLARGARAARQRLRTWDAAGCAFAEALARIDAHV